MAQLTSQHQTITNFTYTPPRLPAYLANTYVLKPIIGLPADEEIKTIHAIIREVNGVSHIPTLHDPDLSIQLAQHLFNIQMAVYRNSYPISISPVDNTYTPPPLPSHIPVSLEPVTSFPSDEELKSVHRAWRASENLASSPSIFDPDLSMKLSQHLFNIQFGRYVQHSTQGEFVSSPRQSHIEAQEANVPPTLSSTLQPRVAQQNDRNEGEIVVSREPDSNTVDITEPAHSPGFIPKETAPKSSQEYTHQPLSGINNAHEETNRLLGGVKDVLENINRALISTQNSLMRGLNAQFQLQHRFGAYSTAHTVINEKGELPSACGLPPINNTSAITDNQIARYLQFYNLETDLIEAGEEPTIKSGMRSQAETLLTGYVYWGDIPSSKPAM